MNFSWSTGAIIESHHVTKNASHHISSITCSLVKYKSLSFLCVKKCKPLKRYSGSSAFQSDCSNCVETLVSIEPKGSENQKHE